MIPKCAGPSGVSVRDAVRSDVDVLMELVAFANPESPGAFEDARPILMQQPPSGPLSHWLALFVVAEDSAGKVIGALMGGAPTWLLEHPGITDAALLMSLIERIGTISAVGVHPEHRGAGVGTALVRHAVKRFASAGYGLVTLNFMPPLEAYYQGLGFTTMGTLIVNVSDDLLLGQDWTETRVAAKALDSFTTLVPVPGAGSPIVSGIIPGSAVPQGARFVDGALCW